MIFYASNVLDSLRCTNDKVFVKLNLHFMTWLEILPCDSTVVEDGTVECGGFTVKPTGVPGKTVILSGQKAIRKYFEGEHMCS
jgi:hypothetical protein